MRQVAIVGFGESRNRAPMGEEWERWGCNAQPRRQFGDVPIPLARSYQLHPRWGLDATERVWVKDCRAPLWTFWPYEEAKDNRLYPLHDVVNLEGAPGPGALLSSSFALMVGHALLEHEQGKTIGTLGLWGIDLVHGSPRERTVEWGGLLWWLGFAAGKGVTVQMADMDLYYPHVYGYEFQEEAEWVHERLAQLYGALATYTIQPPALVDRFVGRITWRRERPQNEVTVDGENIHGGRNPEG